MLRVAIIGASGYTGIEAIEIILRHPEAEVTYLTAFSNGFGHAEEVFPRLKGKCDLEIEKLNFDKLAEVADVVLCCLSHKVSMELVPEFRNIGLKVVDLSADYRLKDAGVYEKFYQAHTDKANLASAVYGLPELFRDQIKGANLIANPGCFPTGSTLAIAPLLKHGLIETETVIVNSVNGVYGAGKKPTSTDLGVSAMPQKVTMQPSTSSSTISDGSSCRLNFFNA